MKVLKLLPFLCALLVAPSTSRAQFVLRADSISWTTVRRYWTAQPKDSIVCLYGTVDSIGAIVDSAVVKSRCGSPAFGALGYIPDWLSVRVRESDYEQSMCDLLKANPGWTLAGAIVGLEDKTRNPLIWMCYTR